MDLKYNGVTSNMDVSETAYSGITCNYCKEKKKENEYVFLETDAFVCNSCLAIVYNGFPNLVDCYREYKDFIIYLSGAWDSISSPNIICNRVKLKHALIELRDKTQKILDSVSGVWE